MHPNAAREIVQFLAIGLVGEKVAPTVAVARADASRL